MVKSEDKAAVVVYVIFILVSIWAYANYLYVDERWIGALGSIVGGIIAGCITLYVLIRTLESNKEALEVSERQHDKDRAIQVMPSLVVYSLKELLDKDGNTSDSIIGLTDPRTDEKGRRRGELYVFRLAFENVGLGSAIYLNVPHMIVFGEKIPFGAGAINKGNPNIVEKQKRLKIEIRCFLTKPIPTLGEAYLEICYEDVLGNKYSQWTEITATGQGTIVKIHTEAPALI